MPGLSDLSAFAIDPSMKAMPPTALAMTSGAAPYAPPTDFSLEEEMLKQTQPDENGRPSESQKPIDTMLVVEKDEPPIQRLMRWGDRTKNINIALELTEGQLGSIGMRVCEETLIDETSRKEWLDKGIAAMDMALQKTKAKNFPWAKASNVIFPAMAQAADQFAARAYPAIVQNRNVVKGVVSGDDSGVPAMGQDGQPVMDDKGEPQWEVPPGEKAARATRIGEHMSWQLLEEQSEWETETDTLLNVLAIMGSEFRKSYYDPDEGRNMSVRVSAKNMIINYKAKSMKTAPRLTEVLYYYPYEIKEKIAAEHFLDYNYWSSGLTNDRDEPHAFLEQHRRLDLDGDGYAEPYIVTVHKESMRVCRIVARWDNEDGIKIHQIKGTIARIIPVQYYTKYDFMPNKEGGIYGYGFGQLLLSMNEAVSTTLNMLLDAGTVQNTGGGFIGKNMNMHSGTIKFKPGEYIPVNATGQSIRESIVPIVHPGPSPVLFQLLGTLIDSAKDISSVKDVLSGDLKAQTMSPTVFMALIEQGLKVFTAIYKRIHRSLKEEFEKLFRLNRIYLEQSSSYRVEKEWRKITREDYVIGSGIDPVSDPTMVVDAQRMARTQVLAEFKDDPLCNGKEIRKRIFEAASIDNIEKILVGEPAPNPKIELEKAHLELDKLTGKAKILVYVSEAIMNMAKADQLVTAPFMQWIQMQFQAVQNEINAIGSGGAQPGQQPPGGGDGAPSGGVPAMEAQPNDQGIPPLPGGLPNPADSQAPAPMGG